MRTHSLTLLLLCLCPVSAMAQDALFKDAIKRGKNPSGYYTATSRDKDTFTLNNFYDAAKKYGYVLNTYDYQKKTINRFGNVYDVVTSIDFFLPEDFPMYAYCRLARNIGITDATAADLKASGIAYLYFDDKINHYDPEYGKYFTKFNNVQWSGEVDGSGKIVGTGRGYLMNDEWLCCFKGTFVNGYPVGKSEYCWLNWKSEEPTFFKKDGALPTHHGWEEVVPLYCTTDVIDPEDCLRELRAVLRTNRTPQLSSLIYGHLGLIPTRFVYFEPDEEAAKIRENVQPLAKAGAPEAVLALDFLTVFDAWNLAAIPEKNELAEKSIMSGDHIEKFKDANYWTILANGQAAVKRLKTVEPEFADKLNEVDNLISDWNQTIFARREEAMKIRGEAVRTFFYDLLESALKSSYSSSPSGPGKESCKIHLVRKDGSDYAYEEFCVGHKGFLGPTWTESFETDGNGYATVSWSEDDPDPNYICNTFGQEFSLLHIQYEIEDLEMENGGSYTICVDCD